MNTPLPLFHSFELQVVANRLQDGTIHHQDLLASSDVVKSMTHLKISPSEQHNQCLHGTIESLTATQRVNIIKLSAITGPFSLDGARKILKYRKKNTGVLRFDLQDLKYFGLLEIRRTSDNSSAQFSDNVAQYSVPLSIRAFVESFIHSDTGASSLKEYQKAQNRFIRFYGEKLRNICKTLQADLRSGLTQLRRDSANYLGFLEILKSAEDFKPSENLWWVVLAVELMYSPNEACEFYAHLAAQAKKRDDLHAFADLRCYQIMQLKELGQDPESLLEQMFEVQDILNNKVDISEGIRSKHFSLATCYCLRGDLLTAAGKTSEAIQWLQQAVSLRKQILGDDDEADGDTGGHFLTARALNALGVALKKQSGAEKMEEAKTCFLQVWSTPLHIQV